MTTDDIYRVLASLRFIPKVDTNNKNEINDFEHMTRIIFDELSSMLNNKYNTLIKKEISCLQKPGEIKEIILDYKDTEIIRLYTKYLLKHHWETNIDESKWLEEQKNIIVKVKMLRERV